MGSNSRTTRSSFASAWPLLLWFCWPTLLAAQDFDFEGAQPAWRLAEADCNCRITSQERVPGEAHSGRSCERIQLTAGHGTYAHLSLPIRPVRVIDDLKLSLWVRSDRGGVQLKLRAVLPHARHPETGQPLTALMPGPLYARVGEWEELTVANVPRLLERQVRVLRSKFGSGVDAREAYVDMLVLNAFGGAGSTTIWTDDLRVESALDASPIATASENIRPVQFEEEIGASATPAPRTPTLHYEGGWLYLDGRPHFPRVIEARGESLAWLKSIGCQTVRTHEPASDAALRAAHTAGVWLLPRPPDLAQDMAAPGAFERVLAWDMGSSGGEDSRATIAAAATQVRARDRVAHRPLLLQPKNDLAQHSRIGDFLLMDRNFLGGSLEFSEYRQWLASRARLARPGTPLWATVPTSPSESLTRQWEVWSGGETQRVGFEPESIRLAAYAALLGGARGLVFTSNSRLDATDEASQSRARAIEWVLRELEVIEPWLTSPAAATPVQSADPHVMAGLLRHERGDLLLAVRAAPGSQYTLPADRPAAISLLAPGLSEAAQAYRIAPYGVQPLHPKRVAGGLRIEIPEPDDVCLVVVTQDPAVVHEISRRLAGQVERLAQLRMEIAGLGVGLAGEVDAQSPQRDPALATTAWLGDVQSSLEQSQRMLSAQDYRGAIRFADRALNGLARVRRAHWDRAVRGFSSPATSPCVAQFGSLPWHWRSLARLSGAQPEANVLAHGDMENLAAMVQAGWQRGRDSGGGISTVLELTANQPRSGGYCLRLAAQLTDPNTPITAFDGPTAFVASPPITARAGTILRFDGWARVEKPLIGGEGLVITDTLGGDEHGERVRLSPTWRAFTLYRAVPQTGPVQLTFALTGLGEAHIDDVTITPLLPNGPLPTGADPVLRFPIEELPTP